MRELAPWLGALSVVGALLVPISAVAQTADTLVTPSPFTREAIARSVMNSGVRFDQPQPTPDPRRACDGCPIRRLWRPYLESLGVNVMYNGINHLRGHGTS